MKVFSYTKTFIDILIQGAKAKISKKSSHFYKKSQNYKIFLARQASLTVWLIFSDCGPKIKILLPTFLPRGSDYKMVIHLAHNPGIRYIWQKILHRSIEQIKSYGTFLCWYSHTDALVRKRSKVKHPFFCRTELTNPAKFQPFHFTKDKLLNAYSLKVMKPGQKKSERNLSRSSFSAASGVSFLVAASRGCDLWPLGAADDGTGWESSSA